MAAKVLTVASTKGGAGKTTIVMALAGTLAAEGTQDRRRRCRPEPCIRLLVRRSLRGAIGCR